MGCSGCSTGRGCSTVPAGCKSNGNCGSGCNKLDVFDWLGGISISAYQNEATFAEVRFKNSHKDFYKINGVEAHVGDVIAVETASGYDIGSISLTGELVRVQMTRKRIEADSKDLKKVLRKATESDVKKWQDAIAREHETMLSSRKLAMDLNLNMKICDVEYQGDNSKATFYYTADERVDFRELIRVLAEKFKVRIEMKQIGARQEAARVGGIGSCGRELCCSTWITDFRSVSTNAARYQQLALNPIKLAGQCGKLKCCLNYELDMYIEAVQAFPSSKVKLEFKKGLAILQKTDIFRKMLWYAYEDSPYAFVPLHLDKVNEIIEANKNGQFPEDLNHLTHKETPKQEEETFDYENVVGQDSLTRFDKSGNNQKKNKKGGKKRWKKRPPKQS